MTTSPSDTGRVREHFRREAFSFDHLYDEERALQRLLRSGLFNRRELALAVARDYDTPSVLDVGGGSGRIGELILEQGASRYVDVDLSDTMLDLARDRLERFDDKVELVQGDFLETPLEGPFDVVLALGYFGLHRGRRRPRGPNGQALRWLGGGQLPALELGQGAGAEASVRSDQQRARSTTTPSPGCGSSSPTPGSRPLRSTSRAVAATWCAPTNS